MSKKSCKESCDKLVEFECPARNGQSKRVRTRKLKKLDKLFLVGWLFGNGHIFFQSVTNMTKKILDNIKICSFLVDDETR